MVRTRATSSTDTDDPRAASPLSDANRPVLHDRPAYEDVRSPYFLSTADHPGLALATPVLTDRNFQPWKRDFKLSIGANETTRLPRGCVVPYEGSYRIAKNTGLPKLSAIDKEDGSVGAAKRG